MGPIERSFREILAENLDDISAETGVSANTSRFYMAGLVSLVELYQEERLSRIGDDPESDDDYINAAFAILSAHAMATLEAS